MPEWPIYQAEGYGEVFMYDHNERLRWFPNHETLVAYGYTGAEKEVVPITWFHDKVMAVSIQDVKTGECYPPEETPHYRDYHPFSPEDLPELKRMVSELGKKGDEVATGAEEVNSKIDDIEKLVGSWE